MSIKKIYCLLIGIIFCACTDTTYQPREGDLVFVSTNQDAFSEAISDATGNIVHVAVVVYNNDTPSVIEATCGRGVTYTPWDTFITINPHITIKRLTCSYPLQVTLERLRSHIGESYDWEFQSDNGKMYCSELVYECFLYDDSTHIFQRYPMNFKGSDGTIAPFWITLYESLGIPIPEGELGTNPTTLSRDTLLQTIYSYDSRRI